MSANAPSPQSYSSSPGKKTVFRYGAALVALVVIIGGLAWVAQYTTMRKKTVEQLPTSPALLKFARLTAQWKMHPLTESATDVPSDEKPEPKDYEVGWKGFYDFPFVNDSTSDVEILMYSTTCDCSSVQACLLPGDELKNVQMQHQESPGEPLVFSNAPKFVELKRDTEWRSLGAEDKKKAHILVKAGEGGIVRLQWSAKSLSLGLNVAPRIFFQRVNSSLGAQVQLTVPVAVTAPVSFRPQRVSMGSLTAGTSAKKDFYAWSSTRDHFDLDLSAAAGDALFEVASTPVRPGGLFSRNDCPDLFAEDPAKLKSRPRVRSVQRVTMTVHENKGDQYLDLGSFFRKLSVKLDGHPAPDVQSPEIMGRVHGDLSIGGADDQARIRLKAFSPRDGAIKAVELSADSKWQLEIYKQEPEWIKVKLTRLDNQDSPKRTLWRLVVIVPENSPGVRSLEDPDSVTLRIVGTPERFVRIPIEGQKGN